MRGAEEGDETAQIMFEGRADKWDESTTVGLMVPLHIRRRMRMTRTITEEYFRSA